MHARATVKPAELDVAAVRRGFPILDQEVDEHRLVYLDNAATVQKPDVVIEAISNYYRRDNANVHRGVHTLSQRATDGYEGARAKVAAFLNAPEVAECLFVRGVTEAVNLVASSWGGANLSAGDVVLLGAQEHHSNIVPWQMVAEARGATVKVIPMDDAGVLDQAAFERLLGEGGVKVLSMPHVSNSLGTVNPVKAMAAKAREAGAVVFVDGAQWVAHGATDVQALGVDFYAFSAHKLYGPTGIGVLWGRRELLDKMGPFQGGGDMIETVTWERTTYAPIPNKFEAGTPHIAGAVGLAAAIDWVSGLGWDAVHAHEESLRARCEDGLRRVPGLTIVGTAAEKAAVVSFTHGSVSSYDLGSKLDRRGIAVRTGHHCTQPVMDRLGIPGTTRASFAAYNTLEEVDLLVEAVREIVAESSGAAAEPAGGGGDVEFAPASAATVAEAAAALAEEFALVAELMSPTEYVQEDLAKSVAGLPEGVKSDATKVDGCMSEVHVVFEDEGDVMRVAGDSNADITKGLVGVMQRLYSGQRAGEVLGHDVNGFLRDVGLEGALSMGRRNGLAGLIQKIRGHALSLTDDAP